MKVIFAKDAWEILKKNTASHLIDVRTEEEWRIIGFPDLRILGKNALPLTWVMGQEENFIAKLEEKIPDKTTPILFLCRSGARSHAAANLAKAHGYCDITNILDGFEDKHGAGMGWRETGLPFYAYPQE